jgi:(S)-ureidoglycine aminohydrolase
MLPNLGGTRSSLKSDHLLHTPDTFIRTPLPGATGVDFIVHAAPRLGAAFTWMTAEFAEDSSLHEAPKGVQRFLYVLEGELETEYTYKISLDDPYAEEFEERDILTAGSFLYIPEDAEVPVHAKSPARAVLIEKEFQLADIDPNERNPKSGKESEITPEPLAGDPDLQVRRLMPDGREWDFAVNTMTYAPGAALAQVEIHVMEHGLLMLEGGGIYRLGDQWYPVTAGDFIWMAPYCPQWFGAIGKTPAKYLIYKDWRRHPLGY